MINIDRAEVFIKLHSSFPLYYVMGGTVQPCDFVVELDVAPLQLLLHLVRGRPAVIDSYFGRRSLVIAGGAMLKIV